MSECDANLHSTSSKPQLVKPWSELTLEAPQVFKTKDLVFPREGFLFFFPGCIILEHLHMATHYMEALVKLS